MTSIKRFTNELSTFLIPTYKTVHVIYEEAKIIITIEEIDVVIHLLSSYPFHPPIVFVNNKKYSSFSIPPYSERISKIIQSNNIPCLCCHSIINNINKWSATYTIKDIIDEINKINILKRRILYFMTNDIICHHFEKILGKNVDKNIENKIMEFL